MNKSEIVAEVLASKPTFTWPAEDWSNHVDIRWYSISSFQLNDFYIYTEANPLIRYLGDQTFVTFTQRCPGEDKCSGMLLYRFGPMGTLAREVACPEHIERFIGVRPVFNMPDLTAQRLPTLALANIPLFHIHDTLLEWPGTDKNALSIMQRAASLHQMPYLLILYGNNLPLMTSLACGCMRDRILYQGERGYFVLFDEVEDNRANIDTTGILVVDSVRPGALTEHGAIETLADLLATRLDYREGTIITVKEEHLALVGAALKELQYDHTLVHYIKVKE
jgi:hypothetical protein